MDEDTNETPKAPYLPFQTFKGYLEELGSKPVPPMLDRTMMRGKSGTDQALLVAALQFFDFIDGDKKVQPLLREFLALNEDDRKHALATLLKARYVNALEVSEMHGSDAMLSESFEKEFGYKADTRRKAVTFFLHAARWCGMDLSANFPVTRMGSGRVAGTGAKRTSGVKRAPARKSTAAKATQRNSAQHRQTTGEVVEIKFGSVGSAKIEINARFFDLPSDTRGKLFALVEGFRELGFDEMDEDEVYLADVEEEGLN